MREAPQFNRFTRRIHYAALDRGLVKLVRVVLDNAPLGTIEVERGRLNWLGKMYKAGMRYEEMKQKICDRTGISWPELMEAIRKAHARWTAAREAGVQQYALRNAAISKIKKDRDSRALEPTRTKRGWRS